MADITMCWQALCPKAGDCYRRQAPHGDHWQSIFAFQYRISTRGVECDGYWPMFKSVATNSTVTGETNGSRT